jgi:peroxiredoxin
LTQLRQEYQEFVDRNAEIIALGPDGPNAFKRFWKDNQLPFIGISDLRSRISDTYYQEVNLLKLGRMPALFIIDLNGRIRYAHYGDSMQDTTPVKVILDLLDQLNNENRLT